MRALSMTKRLVRKLKHSFGAQIILNILAVLAILVMSTGYILYSTIRMQEIVSTSFEEQRYLREVRENLDAFQDPFLEFLSTRSSGALSELLVISQRVRNLVPQDAGVPADPLRLREMEVYSVVSKYLDLADTAIEEKRGMDVARYTGIYAEMQTLYEYVRSEIDGISGARFSAQLSGYETFIAMSRNIQLWNLLFIVFISLFSVLYLMQAVNRISRPMVNLSRAAAAIAAGNFGGDDVRASSFDEIDSVVHAFNRMKHDIHTYIEEIKWQRNVEQEYMQERVRNMKMQQLIRRMELYTLQAQMNPHFLFNTLNTGIQLAIVEGADRTGEYMENLSRLVRHNIREKNVAVPLRHEIEGLESYFYLLRVRFPKNLDLVLDCPKDILDAYTVPATILQPLVENCVVHAFKGSEGRNSIVVRVYVEGKYLFLSVADNGSGMDAEKIAALLKPVPVDGHSEKVMGLENVIQRVYFFFPDDPDAIRIESEKGKGTAVTVRIDTGKELCIAY